VVEACDWIRRSVSKQLEDYEDKAFKWGQRSAGLTVKESEKANPDLEEQQQDLFGKLTQGIEQLVLCELRKDGEADEPTHHVHTYIVTSSDCDGCKALIAKNQRKDAVIVDTSTEQGIDFLEELLDHDITFDTVPQVIVENGDTYKVVPREEIPKVLGFEGV